MLRTSARVGAAMTSGGIFVAAVWPLARRWVAAWAAASLVLLELGGFHVPSDIAGGLLLALLLCLPIWAARRAGL